MLESLGILSVLVGLFFLMLFISPLMIWSTLGKMLALQRKEAELAAKHRAAMLEHLRQLSINSGNIAERLP